MKRFALAAVLAATTAASPLAASDLGNLTDAERDAFRGEVRAYLLEHPEVLMEAIQELEKRQAQAQSAGEQQLLQANAEALFNDGHSWVGGNPEGDVTIVEFMDYRCGYCRKAYPEVNQLLESDGNIRFIVKEFPILGDQSVLGSRFAISVLQQAGDEAYETVHDALMTLRGDITETSLRAIAKDAGLDADAMIAGMDAPEVEKIITENRQLAQALQVNGTPSFVFGDQMVRGYVPLDTMQKIVTEERDG